MVRRGGDEERRWDRSEDRVRKEVIIITTTTNLSKDFIDNGHVVGTIEQHVPDNGVQFSKAVGSGGGGGGGRGG